MDDLFTGFLGFIHRLHRLRRLFWERVWHINLANIGDCLYAGVSLLLLICEIWVICGWFICWFCSVYPQITQITQIILGKGFIHDLRRFARLSLFWCRFAFVNLWNLRNLWMIYAPAGGFFVFISLSNLVNPRTYRLWQILLRSMADDSFQVRYLIPFDLGWVAFSKSTSQDWIARANSTGVCALK